MILEIARRGRLAARQRRTPCRRYAGEARPGQRRSRRLQLSQVPALVANWQPVRRMCVCVRARVLRIPVANNNNNVYTILAAFEFMLWQIERNVFLCAKFAHVRRKPNYMIDILFLVEVGKKISPLRVRRTREPIPRVRVEQLFLIIADTVEPLGQEGCLLYTSDAADE